MTEEVNWLDITTAEKTKAVQNLYKAISAIAAATDQTIDSLYYRALPDQEVSEYQSNFRRSNIAAAKAKLIHFYLKEYYFETGRKLAPELFHIRPGSAFERFVEARRHGDGLKIVKMRNGFGIARRASETCEHYDRLRLTEPYCLELTSDRSGYAVAFEKYGGTWHPLALGESDRHFRAHIDAGTCLLPRKANRKPDPLNEMDDAGEHRFVIVTAMDRDVAASTDLLAERSGDTDLRAYEACVLFVT
ncbi:hypothetical protein [Roseivivax sp. THAF30]|uniref:hypothetical protein n=1 Tax=Roseivivax sp. THAF30 TaxID=2587852 RepID=UPI0012684355|nr:hypothetical protein [Roseivivax sp. THAF30]QFT63787.1 hypothetical protein FIU91_12680 [Roseivivax sp. THAF30]